MPPAYIKTISDYARVIKQKNSILQSASEDNFDLGRTEDLLAPWNEQLIRLAGEILAAIFDDEDHSTNERREIIIGRSLLNRLVLVYFTERDEDLVRIFSARLASKRELRDYEEKADT